MPSLWMRIALPLVGQASGALFATSEAELDSLPRSLEGMDTTLTVGDTACHVAHAQPATREAVAAAGRVTGVVARERSPRVGISAVWVS